MQLIAAHEADFDDLRLMVECVAEVKIYYVTTGRNAWWNTWITRYSPGCMHSTIESAKAFCERRRVQGTVFYIDELPSLMFRAKDKAIAVSEINTEEFLARLNVDRLISIIEVLPVASMTLLQVMYAFRSDSLLWPPSHPKENSTIVSFCADRLTLEVLAPPDALSTWASRSNGPNYYLRWSSRPFDKGRASLHRLVSALLAHL